jgi:hypothetical protein
VPINRTLSPTRGGSLYYLAYSGVRTSLLFTNICFVSLGLLAALRRVQAGVEAAPMSVSATVAAPAGRCAGCDISGARGRQARLPEDRQRHTSADRKR